MRPVPRGIHLRYLRDDLRVVHGVGVFQQGTVALVPRHLAVQLVAAGDFEPVTGPLARVFIVRVGQDTLPAGDAAPRSPGEPVAPTDFERELEEEELAAAARPDDGQSPSRCGNEQAAPSSRPAVAVRELGPRSPDEA
ncbi:MAG TPA: hypothetical protein VHE35_18605 [Kofleriaceae bacterium]|nr:hypothetical protein [Kofleriaceae bacterium]